MGLGTFAVLVFLGVLVWMLGGPLAIAFAVIIGFGIIYAQQWKADRTSRRRGKLS